MSTKDMSNAEKVQIATDLIVAVDSEDADGISEGVVGLIERNNPRLRTYAPLAKVALAAVLRRLFGGSDEDEEEKAKKVARDAAAEAIAKRFEKDRDRDYAWYDPRGWF